MNAPAEPTEPDGSWREWAQRQLALPPGASAQEIRRGILQRLQETDFVPTPSESEAIGVLAGRPAEPTCYRADRELELGEVVDAFCADFFEFAPAERTRRWQELRRECAHFPRLRARLRPLERGLWVERPTSSDQAEPAEILARFLCDVFSRPPAWQAESRRRKLAEIEADPARWERGARRLLRHCPEIAELDQQFVSMVAGWSRRQRRRNWTRRFTALNSSFRRATDAGWRGTRVLVLVFIGTSLIRLLGALATSDGYSPPPPAFDRDRLEEFDRELRDSWIYIETSDDPRVKDGPEAEALRRLLREIPRDRRDDASSPSTRIEPGSGTAEPPPSPPLAEEASPAEDQP